MIILPSKTIKSVTNIHLNINIINKDPSEHFSFKGEGKVETFDLFFNVRDCLFVAGSSPCFSCVLATTAALHHHFLVVFQDHLVVLVKV